MKFLNKLFGSKKEATVTTYQDFWNWFVANEKKIYAALKKGQDTVEEKALNPISEQLHAVNKYFYCQVGINNDNKGHLVVTPEDDIKAFVFVDELLDVAPKLDNWVFTNLKPANGFTMSVEMDGYIFDNDTIKFCVNNHAKYPDEIDITLVHQDFNEEDENTIRNGCLIYLDTILGEFNSVTLIDNVNVKSVEKGRELIPMEKLTDFLVWREKEFIEKYKGFRTTDEEDQYTTFEAKTADNLPILAIMNRDLLDWDAKPSHPWMMVIETNYEGDGNNGMPNDSIYQLMNQFEEDINALLLTPEGYLNIGRQTGLNKRTTYFACKDFKKSSKTVFELIRKYEGKLNLSYEIYKDKYWMTLNQFIHS